jgi:hypothetical protein
VFESKTWTPALFSKDASFTPVRVIVIVIAIVVEDIPCLVISHPFFHLSLSLDSIGQDDAHAALRTPYKAVPRVLPRLDGGQHGPPRRRRRR